MLRSVIVVATVVLVAMVTSSIGESVSNEYHEFFLAFPSSGEHAQLYIDVTTYEADPVELLITNKTGDVLFNLTVDPGEFTNITVPLQYKVTFPSDPDRFKGLHLSTVSDTKVVVYGTVWDPISGSGDSFLALPYVSVPLLEYVYYAVTSNRSNPYMLLVGSQDYTVVEVTPTVNVSVHPDVKLHGETDTDTATTTTLVSGETVRFTIGRLETILLLCIDFGTSLTGSRVKANQSIAFYSGDLCTNRSRVCIENRDVNGSIDYNCSLDGDICDNWNHFSIEQLPQVASWGMRHLTAPIGENADLFVLSSNDSNILTVGCNAQHETTSSLSFNCTFNCTIDSGGFISVPTVGKQFCTIASSKPVIVVLHNEEQGSTLVFPPTHNYKSHYAVSSSAFLPMLREQSNKKSGAIHVAVLINSTQFQPGKLRFSRPIHFTDWVVILCTDDDFAICGYGYTTKLLDGETYSVTHTDGVLAVIAYYSGNATTEDVSIALPLGNAFLTGPQQVFNPNVVALNDETIRISWEPPPTYTSELLIYYTLEITSLPSGPDNLILPPMNMPVEVLYQVVNPLSPGVPYVVTLYATNMAATGESWSATVFTRQFTPLAPKIISAERLNGTTIFVSWAPLSLSEARGFVENYIVTIERQPYGAEKSLSTIVVSAYESEINVFDLTVSESYRVSVRASTVAGHGEASSVVVSVTENVMFQLHFSGLKGCTSWMLANACEAVENTTATVVLNVNQECDSCNMSDNYIAGAGFHCFEKNSDDVTFSASLYGISNDRPLAMLIDALESWVAGNITVVVTPGLPLSVRADCPLLITSRGELCHDSEYECVGDCTDVIIGAIGGCALVIAVVITANVLYCCRRHCDAHGCPSCPKFKFQFPSRSFRPKMSEASNSESQQDEESPKPKKKSKVHRKTKTEEYSSL